MELEGARSGAGPSCWTEAMHKNRSLPLNWSSDLLRKWSVRGVNVAIYMYIYICCNTSLQPWGKHKITGTCTKHILHRKLFIFRNPYNTAKCNLQNTGIWSPYHFNIGLCIEYEPGHKVFTEDDNCADRQHNAGSGRKFCWKVFRVHSRSILI